MSWVDWTVLVGAAALGIAHVYEVVRGRKEVRREQALIREEIERLKRRPPPS